MSNNLKSMTLPEISAVLKELGQPAFRAKQLFSWLHKGVRSFDEMTNIPQNFVTFVKNVMQSHCEFYNPQI